MSPIEDRHPDVLQNIEFAIVDTYKQHPELSDYAVTRVLEAAIEAYVAEKANRPPRKARLDEIEQRLLERVRQMCEWRLGRASAEGVQGENSDIDPITTGDMILCLKRILKSVGRWNKLGGRQGYLNFIVQYVR